MTNSFNESDCSAQDRRFRLALWLIGGSGLTILIVAFAAIIVAEEKEGMAEKVLTMVLPMLATWVGAVIAYYFSGENFERASHSVNKLLEQVTEQKLKSTFVVDVMIAAHGTMKSLILASSDDGSGLQLKTELMDKFTNTITRMPVLDENSCLRFIIHQSMVYKFIAERSMQGSNVLTLTLKDFLDDANFKETVVNSAAFVIAKGTLADAKSRMDAVSDCQDVFVTEDGTRKTPIKGWLTNVDITKHMQA